MKLYLLSQEVVTGYDTYESMVVAALSEEDARTIHPDPSISCIIDGEWANPNEEDSELWRRDFWVPADQIDKIDVMYLGDTNLERGVLCASFKGG